MWMLVCFPAALLDAVKHYLISDNQSVCSQQVGAGVKGLVEGDWVVPFKPFMGTWRRQVELNHLTMLKHHIQLSTS